MATPALLLETSQDDNRPDTELQKRGLPLYFGLAIQIIPCGLRSNPLWHSRCKLVHGPLSHTPSAASAPKFPDARLGRVRRFHTARVISRGFEALRTGCMSADPRVGWKTTSPW